MNELTRCLIADSAAAPGSHVIQALPPELAGRTVAGVPHTIYAELWHITYWQQQALDWAAGIETPCPEHNTLSFPTPAQVSAEPWQQLCERFLRGNTQAAEVAGDTANLDRTILCPSPPGLPARRMSIADQLISLAAHNHYHFGRIVLLRQMAEAWPPPSGGFSW